ncbi:hypothetical protein JCM10908_004012 [Rhodotorula pacifica]|uniref:uncharacterized protein n=1 Tax=Rhodotorula pacifica TaxID=1495444 RepID=UPI00317B60CF
MPTTQSRPLAAPSSPLFARKGGFRILLWNVDGLERLCNTPQFQGEDLTSVLEAANADIVCLQETKMRKRDAKKRDVPLPAQFLTANGYGVVASTAAYPNPKAPLEGLWGVTVCFRTSSVIPQKAETGLALGKRNSSLDQNERIGHHPDLSVLGISTAQLNTLEGEGRIIVLDCRLFVLLCAYMPNLTKAESGGRRDPIKLAKDMRALVQTRIELLKKAGREVLVVGDFNVPPRSQDTHLRRVEKCKEPAQEWYAELVSPTGCNLIDLHKHLASGTTPEYTYFSSPQNRSRNLGTRIDLMFVTAGLLPWIKRAGVDRTMSGSDHLPVYVELAESISDPVQGGVELWKVLNPERDSPEQLVRLPQLARELAASLRPKKAFFQPGASKAGSPSSSASATGTAPTGGSPGPSRQSFAGSDPRPKKSQKEEGPPPKRPVRQAATEVIDLCELESESDADVSYKPSPAKKQKRSAGS